MARLNAAAVMRLPVTPSAASEASRIIGGTMLSGGITDIPILERPLARVGPAFGIYTPGWCSMTADNAA
jgi:hypothetical protein